MRAEKEGLKSLVGGGQAKTVKALQRWTYQCSKRKQKECASFFKGPFQACQTAAWEQEWKAWNYQHSKERDSDPVRNVALGTPGHVLQSAPLTVEFNTMPPSSVQSGKSWRKQGPHQHQTWIYSQNPLWNCSKVLEMLWYLMRTA